VVGLVEMSSIMVLTKAPSKPRQSAGIFAQFAKASEWRWLRGAGSRQQGSPTPSPERRTGSTKQRA
jgi:hypothetical protein